MSRPVARIIDPSEVATGLRSELRARIAALPEPLTLLGILPDDHPPSRVYAEYTRKGCDDVGVRFVLRQVRRLDVEAAIRDANADAMVHGIIVYYPVFGGEHDAYLRDCLEPNKDIEGMHSIWARRLYENHRFVDEDPTKKAILPCTPLAILKLLDAAGVSRVGSPQALAGTRAVVFNRSEVVGRPLASMLANDGASVVSFDVDGPLAFVPRAGGTGDAGGHDVRESSVDRAEALAAADVVITGVPSSTFPRVRAAELKPGCTCLNFSTVKNFDDDVTSVAEVFVPRVGPMTVTMALRNTLRLYTNARR